MMGLLPSRAADAPQQDAARERTRRAAWPYFSCTAAFTSILLMIFAPSFSSFASMGCGNRIGRAARTGGSSCDPVLLGENDCPAGLAGRPARVRRTLAAVLREVSQQRTHRVEPRGVDHGTARAPDRDEPRLA